MFDAVLFDFGGVITSSPFEGFDRYERAAGLPVGLIRQINSTDPDDNAWAKLERSDVDRDGFCDLFEAEARALGQEVDARSVLECLKTKLRPEVVAAVRRLSADYKTAILTNNLVADDDADSSVSPTGDMASVVPYVDAVIESSKVGVRKPETQVLRNRLRHPGRVAIELRVPRRSGRQSETCPRNGDDHHQGHQRFPSFGRPRSRT